MTTLHRRSLLLQVLSDGGAASQQGLVEALADHGIQVTQATVSRDLAAIGAIKSSAGYSLPGASPGMFPGGSADEIGVLRAHATWVAAADSMVVVKTAPGHAAIVGDALDASQNASVVGTIAGENTVFVATPSKATATRLANRWAEVLTREDAA